MYKNDLALNNLQWLKCHKTQPKQSYLITDKKNIYSFSKNMHTI